MPPKRKNYSQHRGQKKKFKKATNPQDFDRKKRNIKFMKRSKETEELHRRQKIIEDKYKEEARCKKNLSSESESEEENPFEQLLSRLKPGTDRQPNVIDSSSDEEGVDSEVSSDEEEDEDDEIEDENEEVEDEDEEIEDEDEELGSDESETGDNDIDQNDELASEYTEEELSESEGTQKLDCDSSGQINQVEEPELIEEEELDEEIETSETSLDLDPFCIHLEKCLAQSHVDNLLSKLPNIEKTNLSWNELGNLIVEIPKKGLSNKSENGKEEKKKLLLDDALEFASQGVPPSLLDHKNLDLKKSFVKQQLILKVAEQSFILSPLQTEIFSIINNYQDFFYSQRTLDNADEIRWVYCLHVLNHMLKTRSRILHHNARLSADSKKDQAILSDVFRDQGLVRPKVLIILPFKAAALKVVNILASLLFGPDEKTRSKHVLHYNRFVEEYSGDTIRFPKTNPKPDDYEKTFSGNTDDTFRIGISLTKKSMKLYTEFYSSDILLASPLGLRMIIGAPGDAERDFDFLTSIEILVLDQVELFFAQNWEHIIHVLDHMHLQPQSVRNTDFSRVRTWCVDGLSKFYRQTILLMSHELPEFRSLFNNKCFNYRGKVKQANPVVAGSIRTVLVQIPQIFHKVEVSSVQKSFDTRFKYFIEEILPQFKSPSMSHCMIYIPSYFDYVRLRNYFKSESVSFVQICEYTKDAKIARARDMFFHSGAHFLLYSERAHFFRRTRIKGIRHLIMYQPPNWPHFYPEMLNLMHEANQNSRDGLDTSMSVTVLYTKYDIFHLSNIIGTERAQKICQSAKTSHMFMTGE